MILPGTNITLEAYVTGLERMPIGIHQLRRDMHIADPELVDAWHRQLDWMLGQFDNASDVAPRTMRWRMLRALARGIWPLALLNFALRFPRLAGWMGLV